ncbi:unnamed protein product [Calypogeia fissa]
MAMTSMRTMILLLFLPVFLSTMQRSDAVVLVNNTSAFNVSVYDTNTTLILDLLEPQQTTTFPLDTGGPDLFEIRKYGKETVTVYQYMVLNNFELLLYGKHELLRDIRPLHSGPAPAPSSDPGGETTGG